MSFLNNILGSLINNAMSSSQVSESPIGKIANSLIQQNGGVTGLLDKFQQAGLGEIAQSWVSTSENQAIIGDQIKNVLGDSQLASLAGQVGITPDVLSQQIAHFLPNLIDQMTPNGDVKDAEQADLSVILAALLKK